MPKWSDAFRAAIRRETGAERFTYVTAVAKLVGDRAVWETYRPFQEALGGNPVRIITFREMVADIQGRLTTTLASTEIGRMLQLFTASGIRVQHVGTDGPVLSVPASKPLPPTTRHLPAGEDFLLLPPAQQPVAYANVDAIFATRAIHRGDRPRVLPRGAEIAPAYRAGGRDHGLTDYLNRTQVAGLLVLHDGAIRLERYALGLTESTRWTTMSTVKSLTATLVGVALQEGRIGSLEETVSDHLPALRGSAYDAVTIRHLLTMSSGVRWSEDYTDRASEVNRYSKSLGDKVPGGVLALMRSLPRAAPPGSRFAYCTGDTYVLGCLIGAAMGEGLAATMSRAIWGPAGMECDGFYTLESDGGQEIGGSRAGIALRDFGRFGQFILDDGVADGRRILPEGWVAEAGRRHFTLDPASNGYGADGYGFSWWIGADGAMVAVGFAGQSIYVNRATRTVIVTLSCWPQPPFAAAHGIDFGAERRAFHAGVLAALAQ